MTDRPCSREPDIRKWCAACLWQSVLNTYVQEGPLAALEYAQRLYATSEPRLVEDCSKGGPAVPRAKDVPTYAELERALSGVFGFARDSVPMAEKNGEDEDEIAQCRQEVAEAERLLKQLGRL